MMLRPILPIEYQWLETLNPVPRMVAEACRLYGTVEEPGVANSPVILGWAKELGLDQVYSADEIPWCGLFMAIVAKRGGKAPPSHPLWAADWVTFGTSTQEPALGDVLVFRRPGGGGHVGLCIGDDDSAFHVLGGNQSDRVCFTRIRRDRLVAARRPIYSAVPSTAKPYRLAASGQLSVNEA